MHFNHLTRLMRYIEPRSDAAHAFAIGNLSRDDTQHEPGHGALSMTLGFRIAEARDHAGRGNPPFAHGIVAVDRALTAAVLLDAATAFHRRLTSEGEESCSAAAFYRTYTRIAHERPDRVASLLQRHTDAFSDLPRPPRSSLSWSWVVGDAAPPQRVIIVHGDDAPFETSASAAATMAAMLYRSNIKWTSITTGREGEIPGGTSIRFARDRDITQADRRSVIVRLDDLAEDEGALAQDLFGARRCGAAAPVHVSWRERHPPRGTGAEPAGAAAAPPATRAQSRELPPAPPEAGAGLATGPSDGVPGRPATPPAIPCDTGQQGDIRAEARPRLPPLVMGGKPLLWRAHCAGARPVIVVHAGGGDAASGGPCDARRPATHAGCAERTAGIYGAGET
jgi:hypothetical protein